MCILGGEKVTNSIEERGGGIYTTYRNISTVVFRANSMKYKPSETIRI